MNLALALAIYFVCWWITLFAVLPFGVTTQQEAGEVAPGTPESAPIALKLMPKLLVTTVISGLIFGLIYWLMESGAVSLDDIPLLPRFENPGAIRP